MPDHRPLIAHVADAELEAALRARLQRRRDAAGGFGELEALALRLGLMQGQEEPRFRTPQLMIFASDHGIAVEGIAAPGPSTARQVQSLLAGQWPLAAFARAQGLALTVVDAGVAERLPALEGLLTRKIAHGTRNARLGPAMSLEQALAALRAGIEIADTTPGNAVGCAGLGIGSAESAALLLSRLTDLPVRDLLRSGAQMPPHRLAHLMVIAQGAHSRHRSVVDDPVELLAALGGFDIAMMAGLMLGAARRRSLVLVDGLAACAALCVAQRIDAAVIDYALFARSHGHQGLDLALGLFRASSLLELGLDSIDGTGAVLAWPLVNAAALLLSAVKEAVPVGEPAPALLPDGAAMPLPVDAAPTPTVG